MTDAPTPEREFQTWKNRVDSAKKRLKDWHKEGESVWKRYRGAAAKKNSFNILWANTETLRPALYNSVPRPDVRRRFRDADTLGKVASQAMERGLEVAVDGYSFDCVMKSAVLDLLLPGQGLARVRYIPSLRQVGDVMQTGMEEAETERSHEAFEGQYEELEYEQVAIEHVDWRDFVWGYCKTWADCPWQAFRHDLTKEDVRKQFGDDIAKQLTFERSPQSDSDDSKRPEGEDEDKTAEFWEVWDKEAKRVFFLTAGVRQLIFPKDNPEGEPPIEFEGFFCVPEPLRAVEDSETTEPTPLWQLYKEQAEELDRISLRINKIVSGLKLRGVYDATMTELGDLMDGEDNHLIGVTNAAHMRAAGGIAKGIWWMPTEQAAMVLRELYVAREACKVTIYELTGISDVSRGQTNPNETLGAQELKANFGSQRVKRLQREVQRFARDLIRMMATVIGDKFQSETLQAMTGIRLPTGEQKQAAQMALQQAQMSQQPPPPGAQETLQLPTWDDVVAVLRDDMARQYRIDVETDSTVQASIQSDMQGLSQVLQGLGSFWQMAAPMVQASVLPVDAVKAISLAICRRARLGLEVEDAIDKMQPPPPPQPNPMQQQEMEAQKAEREFKMKESEMKMRAMQEKSQAENARTAVDMEAAQMDQQFNRENHRMRMAELAAKMGAGAITGMGAMGNA